MLRSVAGCVEEPALPGAPVTGVVLLIVCFLAVVGAITCACMIIDACVGLRRFFEVRRKLRELRGQRNELG